MSVFEDFRLDRYSFRNRILNGDFKVNQRFGTSAATISGSSTSYVTDKWYAQDTRASAVTFFTTLEGSNARGPQFQSFMNLNVGTAGTFAATDHLSFIQKIEDYLISDLQWGTTPARPVTLSFYSYATATGTYGGAITNFSGGAPRSYPFTYVVTGTNLFQLQTVTISGDSTGTWSQNQGTTGLGVIFDFGAGTSVRGTAGTWVSSALYGALGAASPGTSAGFQANISQVQLEVGAIPTHFENRHFPLEQLMCQRYFEPTTGYVRSDGVLGALAVPFAAWIPFRVTKRATPTLVVSGSSVSNAGAVAAGSATTYGYVFSAQNTDAGTATATRTAIGTVTADCDL